MPRLLQLMGAQLVAAGLLALPAPSSHTRHSRLHQPARLPSPRLAPQVLTLMAPLQLAGGDPSGAQSMITSAITLAKAIGDAWSQGAAAGVAAGVFSEVGTPEALAKVPELQAMQERKRQEVAAAQQAAMQQAEQHGYVLGWDLAG